MKTHIFHVNGMHCKACVALIESELEKLPNISKVKASLNNLSVEVEGDFGDQSVGEIGDQLSGMIQPHGYTLSIEKTEHNVRWVDFKIAVPVAILFIGTFIGLQKLGIVNLITTSEVTYGTAFVIGLIASVSTCMAVVGGLVLSMSANFAKEGNGVFPQVLFHVGRLISFFILGGVIGALGSVFQLGQWGTFIFSLLIALVLIILGLNLLDVFPWAKKLQLTLPSFVGKKIHGLKDINHTLTPFLLGAVTFFLPCGFTQSMQLYTLTTGSFVSGAFTMFVFALGTLPVLALLSFSFMGIKSKTQSGIFFKAAGLVVVFFGIVNLLSSLVIAGLIPPILNF